MTGNFILGGRYFFLVYYPDRSLFLVMNNVKLNEKESLALISQMILETKQNLGLGQWNKFLFYGYASAIIGVGVYFCFKFTSSPMSYLLWFILLPLSLFAALFSKKHPPKVVSYLEKSIKSVWIVINTLFFLSLLIICLIYALSLVEVIHFGLMAPLSLMYVAIGCAITGVLLKEKVVVWTSGFSFLLGVYILVMLHSTHLFQNYFNLLLALSFVIMLILPGHLLNAKAKREL